MKLPNFRIICQVVAEKSLTEKKSYVLSKGIYFVIYGIISELTDKGQFQYLTNLKGASRGDLPVYNRISLTKIKINILSENT